MTRLRRILAVVIVLIVVAAGVGIYLVRRSGHSTPVAERQAITRYRGVQGRTAATGSPAPGVYIYAVRGWECAGIAKICLRRSLPALAYLVVTRSGDQLTLEVELSAQHLEAQRLRVTAQGRLLEWERARISILGVTQDDAHSIAPPTTLSLPSALHVGQTWSQTFDDGGLPVTSRNAVTGRQIATVAGLPISTWLVTSSSTTGGAHPGTERDVDWHDSELGIDARFTIDRRITGVFPYRLQLDATLQSVTPRR